MVASGVSTMRKNIRTRVFVSIIGAAAFAAWAAACGGSDSQDVVSAPDAAPEVGFDTSKPDVQVADTSTDVVKDTGPIYDAGPANTLEAGPEYGEAGIPCVAGGKLEEEPNNDKDAANTVDPTRCGAILLTADGGLGSPGTAESDFLTFELKSTTKTFFIQFSGDISMKIDVDGQSVTVSPTMSPPIPFVKDKPYYIEIRSLNGKRANWRVTIFES
jgi:hypothetical protein